MIDVPGLTISAPSSGSGKTTFTLGLLRVFKNKGLKVQPYKNGPDYIDPTFHEFASGRQSYNLDTWGMNEGMVKNNIHIAQSADLIINEGSMGLYDGVSYKGAMGYGSTAEIAKKFGWPIILVIDTSGQAQSAGATAMGFLKYQNIPFGGVILNNVASLRHERLVKIGMKNSGVRVLGSLPRQKEISMPERHLGLVQVNEQEQLEEKIETFANLVENNTEVLEIYKLARNRSFPIKKNKQSKPPGQRIAVAKDEAFSFIYPHVINEWKEQGAEIINFSPLNNESPEKNADFIWFPGGYPELHLKKISNAHNTKKSLKKLSKKVRIHGECGGYMVLGKGIVDQKGKFHEMFGLLGLVTSFEKKKLHLGYRLAKPKYNSINKSKSLRGHEFHYSTILEQPDNELYEVFDANNIKVNETGSFRNKVSGTFFHYLSECK